MCVGQFKTQSALLRTFKAGKKDISLKRKGEMRRCLNCGVYHERNDNFWGIYRGGGDRVIEEGAFEPIYRRGMAIYFKDQVDGWRAEQKGSSQEQSHGLKFSLMLSGLA